MPKPESQKPNNASLTQNVKELKKTIISNTISLALVAVLLIVIIFVRTVAWQTNVAHTGGLMFTADVWSFDAEIQVVEQNTPATPGENGTIGIKITNDSPQLAVASVKVLKDQIVENMRQRMFFYVDVPTVRNGENVSLQYLNSRSGHVYTVFPHQTLNLVDGEAQQPLINWEWTYDDLGYYVYGQRTNQGVRVEEYLMPIKYDFDYMRTTFDANGKLKTIDGSTTKEAFLTEFSKTDGYAGTIDTSKVTSDGFYPVEVDSETGYGVFAYFSTLEQINKGSENDTAAGTNNASIGQAIIQVIGQNGGGEGVLVLDETGFTSALENPGLNVLTLDNDIELTESVSLESGSQTVIDLNGHTISSASDKVFDLTDGASLILNNGAVVGNGETAVFSVASNVTMNNVSISNVDNGVLINDHKSAIGGDSTIHLTDCEIDAKEQGLWIYGNNKTDNKTKIIVENCSVTGQEYAGIISNGTYYGTDILVENSTVEGKYAAIYFPQKDSELTIKDSKLEGYTGLAVKGGTVNVIDSTVIGTGAYSPLPEPSKLSLSGWWDTGDGIYLEANYTEWETKIFISGEKTRIIGTETDTLAVRMYPADAEKATIEITGGVFNTDVTDFVKDGYKVNKNAEDYEVVKN